jgi:hypothetical protein
MPTYKILSSERAKRFYDWMGAKQDTQCFYERPALADLIVHLELARAESVIEFGCGTGRLAEVSSTGQAGDPLSLAWSPIVSLQRKLLILVDHSSAQPDRL